MANPNKSMQFFIANAGQNIITTSFIQENVINELNSLEDKVSKLLAFRPNPDAVAAKDALINCKQEASLIISKPIANVEEDTDNYVPSISFK